MTNHELHYHSECNSLTNTTISYYFTYFFISFLRLPRPMMTLWPVHITHLENQVKSMEHKQRLAIKQSLSQRPKSYEFHCLLLTAWNQKQRKRERDFECYMEQVTKERKIKQGSLLANIEGGYYVHIHGDRHIRFCIIKNFVINIFIREGSTEIC